ncbi:hypothetical protein FNV43_RR08451 [Rhamnella rubrinervis]|uniref:Uncharacterized protein n=1 Tax=Rhamnella rubrinervis TaxID=2594499 RepID=A0A8K0H9C7_9ROSA|nr:hypothetical protein FNV43_RR08451 [Rhamnella rubrinervis]
MGLNLRGTIQRQSVDIRLLEVGYRLRSPGFPLGTRRKGGGAGYDLVEFGLLSARKGPTTCYHGGQVGPALRASCGGGDRFNHIAVEGNLRGYGLPHYHVAKRSIRSLLLLPKLGGLTSRLAFSPSTSRPLFLGEILASRYSSNPIHCNNEAKVMQVRSEAENDQAVARSRIGGTFCAAERMNSADADSNSKGVSRLAFMANSPPSLLLSLEATLRATFFPSREKRATGFN